MNYDCGKIRELIKNALGDEDLSNLCFDEFRPVYEKFTNGQTKDARIRMLVEYTEYQKEIPKLLEEIKKINPNRYAEFEPHLKALSQTMYTYLLRLGYRDQEVTFTRFIHKESVAAFLIHIYPDPENGGWYGQHWLLNRLKLRVLQGIVGKKVILDLTCLTRSRDVKALWRELSRQVGLRQDSKPTDICDRVYQCWQTQNIFLILDSVDFMPEEYMKELLQEFWSPLVSRVQQNQTSIPPFKLLMFLIDKSGSAGQWNIQFADRPNPVWRAEIPVKLPWIQKFSSDVLTNWILSDLASFPQFIDDTEVIVETVLNNSDNGVPQWVFQEICALSNCEWCDEWSRL